MSATETRPGGLCGEVEDQLSQVLDGTAAAVLYDHIADCDACRDLRHEAAQAAEAVAGSGADFRAPADFADGLLARIDAARPSAGATSGPVAKAAPGSMERAAADAAPREAAPPAVTRAGAPNDTIVDPRGFAEDEARSERPALGTAQAEPAPPAGSGREEAAPDARPGMTEGAPASAEPENAAPDRAAATAPPDGAAATASTAVPAKSHHVMDTAPGSSEREAPRVSPTLPEAGAAPAAAPAEAARAAAPKGSVISIFRRRSFVAVAIAAAAAAAGVGFSLKGRVGPADPVAIESPWSGKIAAVKRASADKAGGLEACDESGSCAPLAEGAAIPLPATLRTDARTRAHLALEDGTQIAIDRGSRLWLGAGKARAARVDEGAIVADVAKLDGAAPARIAVPQGEVEVLGTKLAITASADRASVEVARGAVRVTGERGGPVEVRAGEEATVSRGGAPEVASATSLADVMEWSDRSAEEVDAPALRGLGELRARRPG
ncbi:MAG: FecR domain-containing protein, partial [Polyangiaceae bacterium]|nr:FecR domain-containing protein [Polyangiaceae bacterium]